ncbi:MAG: putative bifunctional diguanylate cyclase/phosphodiesterase [Candidatus Dormibacteria bacterium]
MTTPTRSRLRRILAVLRLARDADFEQVFVAHPQALLVHDTDTGRVLAANDAAVRQYGYPRAQLLAMTIRDVTSGDDPAIAEQHRTRDGRLIDVHCDLSRVTFRGREAVLVLASEVGDQRRMQQRLEHNAHHDPLTGLANQVLLRQQIREAVDGLRDNGSQSLAVLVLDLDGFKTVNDTLGHTLGDRVLAITGARIARCIKKRDTAGRLGGDEFGIVLASVNGDDNAVRVAERIIGEVQKPINLRGRSVVISASCGVAVTDHNGRTPEELISDADVAMYAAKSRGAGSVALFSQPLRIALINRIGLEQDLAAALTREEFEVLYQPQVDLRSRRVIAVEALVRWRHPTRGSIPPDEFIPVAEQLGLVSAIDEWVLRTALRALRQWTSEGLETLRLGINLSRQDLGREDLAATVRESLIDARLEPWRLELELTETAALAQPSAAKARLHELRAMGVRIAIDDFGTGFSMLSSLRDLPIDRLKIDRSFVTDLDQDEDARAIVGPTITMGHALGLDLCAEGVESAATADLLETLGCDSAQGFHFARPIPGEQVLEWMRKHSRAVSSRPKSSLPANVGVLNAARQTLPAQFPDSVQRSA